MDKMLIDSYVDLEENNMKSNNFVKRGKKIETEIQDLSKV